MIPHAKNQPPRPNIVAYRPQTDWQTDRHAHTETHTDAVYTEEPFLDFFLKFKIWF